MANIVLLFLCLLIGILLRRSNKLPADAPATINGLIINVALPGLILTYMHRIDLRAGLLSAAAMPWLLFLISATGVWCVSKAMKLSRGTTGALIMLAGLGNTSFIGLPMIESFYGPDYLPIGILIDQLGSYLVLSTLGIAVACVYSDTTTSWREVARRIATFPPLLAMVLALLLIPVRYPEWLEVTLLRLGTTVAPLALISVGFQLRFNTLAGNRTALGLGLGLKLIAAPALIALLYLGWLHEAGKIAQVTLFEASMAPMVGASIVATQHGLNPPLISLMVGVGTVLSFLTLPLWWTLLSGF